jgi:hypothetical protein
MALLMRYWQKYQGTTGHACRALKIIIRMQDIQAFVAAIYYWSVWPCQLAKALCMLLALLQLYT